MEIAEFLLARIAEDAEVARDAALTVGWDGFGEQRIRSGQRWNPSYHVVKRARDDGPTDRREVADCGALFGISTANHIARWDPARVLAKCKADRRIVEAAVAEVRDARRRPGWTIPDSEVDEKGRDYRVGFENARAKQLPDVLDRTDRLLRLLALPYADHPDYDPEWKP